MTGSATPAPDAGAPPRRREHRSGGFGVRCERFDPAVVDSLLAVLGLDGEHLQHAA